MASSKYTRHVFSVASEHRLNAFHLRCFRKVMGNTWKNKVTKNDVLCKARTTTVTVYAMLSELRLRWLGHVSQMDKGRILKDLMYGQIKFGTRSTGCPQLRFKNSCKRDRHKL